MRTESAVATYARALFDLTSAADVVDAADVSLATMAEAVRGHVDLKEALVDTSVTPDAKRAVLRDIFGEAVVPEALAIVTVMVERGMADRLSELARAFRELAEEERGIAVAEVTTVVPLTDALRSRLVSSLADVVGRPVVLRERVEEGIVGGIVIRVAGRVLDGSVASQLTHVRTALVNAPQGGVS